LNFWDENYSVAGYKYGTAPNEFLVEQSTSFPKNAKILLPGDGEGRNSVWLAKEGHQVTSIDSSGVGIDKAQALANLAGVSIKTEQADLTEWSSQGRHFDVVVLTYLHLPPNIRSTVHKTIAYALKPKGLLVLEAFHPKQLGYNSGGPKAEEMLYSIATIRSDFGSSLSESYAFEGETVLNEGPGHQGPAFVSRWVGIKN
jgi:2-polyprenyl-3-methyl-5-hydroxy-6-metoxy-1,4-benzoquinol methylase